MGLLLAGTDKGKQLNESVQTASSAVKKANSALGITRNGVENKHIENRGADIRMALHKPVVRPHLEHGAQFQGPTSEGTLWSWSRFLAGQAASSEESGDIGGFGLWKGEREGTGWKGLKEVEKRETMLE